MIKSRLLQATASLALAFAFAIPAKVHAAPQNLLKDFNQDGKTDILWYQPSSGRVNTWLLDGTKVVANPDLSWNVPGNSGWEIKGTGDFNQDGKTDVLWYQPSSGRVNAWLLDGTKVVANPDLSWKVPGNSGWEIKGTGDFNQDGKTDILWYQPSSGRVNAWLLDGTKVVANPDLSWNVPGDSGWEIKGTGDFNQDGKTDILWYQPSSGSVNAWLLDGTNVVSNPDLSWNVPGNSGWQIVSR
ncbi:VCBS repeat-containing protein [Nostoc sp. FACHB-973]|nr:VCBS repeat-containing protein [Nostoc sp. FACHB-973]